MLNKISKEDERLLREYAGKLPVIMYNTHEVHIVEGSELIELNYDDPKDGKIKADKKYFVNMPVQIAANHYRRLKKAWLKDGQKGLQAYLNNIASIIKQNQAKHVA